MLLLSQWLNLITESSSKKLLNRNLNDYRTNARGVDLNRNFPDYFRETPGPRQPETTAIMTWMHNVTFVLSASLHGGALVASYPYESSEKRNHFLKLLT